MATGLRERKRQAVRRELVLAALRLMAEDDYEAVTVERIAAEAGVSARTFFNYFSTKGEVLDGPSPEEAADVLDRVLAQPARLTPLQALGNVIGEDLARAERRAEDWQLWMRVLQRNPVLLPRLVARLGETEQQYAAAVAARAGLPAEGVYPRLVGGCALVAVRTAVAEVLHGRSGSSVSEALTAALALLEAGLPPPGPPRADVQRQAVETHAG